jgi:hypothetical protein
MVLRYLANLSNGRLTLWCYFIWYLTVLIRYFDANPRLWGTSIGLALIIGYALYVNTTSTGKTRVRLERWQVVRLYLMPFCVSSFAALVKGKGFVLIFSPNPKEIVVAVTACLLLVATVMLLRRGRALAHVT